MAEDSNPTLPSEPGYDPAGGDPSDPAQAGEMGSLAADPQDEAAQREADQAEAAAIPASEQLPDAAKRTDTSGTATGEATADTAAEPAEEAEADEDASLLERAKDAVGDAVESVKEVAGNVAETAKSVAEDVSETAKNVVEDVKEGAEKVAEDLGIGDGETIDPTDPEVDPVDTTALTSVDAPEDLETSSGVLGYYGEIQGRVITLDELEGIENERDPEDPEEADADFLQMLEDSMTALSESEIVSGTVVAVRDKDVVIDIGGKSDGVVPKSEFDDELEVGDTVEVFLERLEDRRGQVMVSKTKADDARRWETILDAFENDGILEGTIVKRIKGGMIVNLLGAEAFLPGSQVDVRPVRDFDLYLGKTMEFKVVKTNPANGNVVVSHKALIMKDLLAQREQILDSMEVGQVLEGQVKNIVNFGAFIDLGGVDGLLHITDLSWGRVGHPSEVLELDQKINVVVLDYDKERQRISLGLKQLLPHPWDDIRERLAVGMEIEGRVVSITDYGAFVEIEKGIEGLVHISEMSWTEHVKHPTQKVQLGQMVNVKILGVDEEDKKISLGMKQLEPDPWEGILERFPIGSVTTGQVRNLTTFGAFVELEPGIDGLVHVSDLSWTKRVKHPSEVVKRGQDLEVQVLDIDVAQRRISLGHKQVQTDPWNQYTNAYGEGTLTSARVIDVNDGGVVVELPLEAEGFIPSSHLERSGHPADAYRIGDELELTVIRLDRNDRQIVLSETEQARAVERAERNAERRAQQGERKAEQKAVRQFQQSSRGPATLGELSGLAALRDQMAAAEADAPEVSSEGPGNAETPPVDSLEEATVPEVMVQPADEAVAELTGNEDEAPGEEAELGKASATVEGDDAENVADKAE